VGRKAPLEILPESISLRSVAASLPESLAVRGLVCEALVLPILLPFLNHVHPEVPFVAGNPGKPAGLGPEVRPGARPELR
jgi:hypothetical protein